MYKPRPATLSPFNPWFVSNAPVAVWRNCCAALLRTARQQGTVTRRRAGVYRFTPMAWAGGAGVYHRVSHLRTR